MAFLEGIEVATNILDYILTEFVSEIIWKFW